MRPFSPVPRDFVTFEMPSIVNCLAWDRQRSLHGRAPISAGAADRARARVALPAVTPRATISRRLSESDFVPPGKAAPQREILSVRPAAYPIIGARDKRRYPRGDFELMRKAVAQQFIRRAASAGGARHLRDRRIMLTTSTTIANMLTHARRLAAETRREACCLQGAALAARRSMSRVALFSAIVARVGDAEEPSRSRRRRYGAGLTASAPGCARGSPSPQALPRLRRPPTSRLRRAYCHGEFHHNPTPPRPTSRPSTARRR